MDSSGLDQKKAEIKRLIGGSTAPKQKPTQSKSKVVNIRGDGNVVAGGDVHIYNAPIAPPTPKPIIKTGDGVLTAHQKGELRDRVTDWVQLHGQIKQRPLSWGSAWNKVNRHVGVNSYHEIPQEHFDAAVRFIQVEMGKLNSMPSAKKKSPEWRNKRIAAIHARCKQKDLVSWRIKHMEKKFGRTSMIELDDTELEQLYRAVFAKK